jgi:hypothetical protein
MQLRHFLRENRVAVLEYAGVCRAMDELVRSLNARWFWSPLRVRDAECKHREGHSTRDGRDTNGYTSLSRVYERGGKPVPLHILQRVGLVERGLPFPVYFFVSEFEVRKPEPALLDPFLMAMVSGPEDTRSPYVLGQWDEPCWLDPDPDTARYAAAAAPRTPPASHRGARAAARQAGRPPMTISLSPVGKQSGPRRYFGLTFWEWVLVAAFVLTVLICR